MSLPYVVWPCDDWPWVVWYVCESIDLFFRPSVYISVYLFVYPSIYLSIYLYIYLPNYLSIYLSIYLFIYISICLSIYLSTFYLSIRPSIFLYLSQFMNTHSTRITNLKFNPSIQILGIPLSPKPSHFPFPLPLLNQYLDCLRILAREPSFASIKVSQFIQRAKNIRLVLPSLEIWGESVKGFTFHLENNVNFVLLLKIGLDRKVDKRLKFDKFSHKISIISYRQLSQYLKPQLCQNPNHQSFKRTHL